MIKFEYCIKMYFSLNRDVESTILVCRNDSLMWNLIIFLAMLLLYLLLLQLRGR